VLRRAAWSGGLCTGLIAADDRLQIDFDEREVLVDGQRIPLSPTEFRLLYHLVQHAGRTLPFEALLARAWGPEYRRETHYVHLYVAYLRQKIEPDLANPRYILTRRGLGYSFRALAAAG
jgi:two-component system KDP operon response regulator KdpE